MNKIILPVLVTIVLATAGIRSARAENPEANYRLYCAQCHGLKGNGSGINKADMPTTPRDHTNGAEMPKLKDKDLYLAIEQGGVAVGKSALMPAWKGVLTDAEIKEIVAYLRKLCNCSEK